MAESMGRFEWVGKLARAALLGILVLLALMVIGTVALMVVTVFTDMPQWSDLAPWLLVLVIVSEVVGVVLVFMLYGLVRVVVANEAAVRSTAGEVMRMETLLTDQTEATKKLVDLASLSDRAKSLIYREREVEALREVIHHDMVKQDYGAAESLIETLETHWGFSDEAVRLREELAASQKATLEEKIDKAVARIQGIIDQRDWTQAVREAKRIQRVFPDNPKVTGLGGRIEDAYSQYKRELLEAYGEAVKKKDIDRGFELLKELDQYLTPQEAAAMQESARGVTRARLLNLGVQFAIQVTDKNWKQALAVGEQIVSEYPNTRMAHEVESKMELLQARANAEAAGGP